MADNLTTTTTVSTVPSGTVIATDDAGSAHYQKVKLVDGTADSTTVVKADSSGGLSVGGHVAHDAADAGNPVGVGLNARTTNPTAVQDGDRVRATADDLGRSLVVLNQVRDLVGQQYTQIATTTETTIATAAASLFHDLVNLVITNQTATAVVCLLRDTTAGAAVARFALAANGGIVVPFQVPFKQTTVNTNWTLQLSAGSITVDVVAQFVKNI